MFRRSFVISASAAGLLACGASTTTPTEVPDDLADFEILVIDAQTPFGESGKPYLTALREAEAVDDTGIDWLPLPDYGRDNGAMVRGSVIAVADERERLAAFFSGLPPTWQLPDSHGLRFEHGPWPDGSGPRRWGARVVQLPPVVTLANVVAAEAEADTVWLSFDPPGAEAFERETGANIGQKLAFVIDDEIVSDPIINERIPGGLVQITSGGSPEAASELAERLMS